MRSVLIRPLLVALYVLLLILAGVALREVWTP